MIKFLQKIFTNKPYIFEKPVLKSKNWFYFQKWFKSSTMMEPTEGLGSKIKNPVTEEIPPKKLKLYLVENETLMQRTVATMCGAWRPDEVDGGLVLVFKTRDPGLSPNPTREEDYPENIEDFWAATLTDDASQVRSLTPAADTEEAKKPAKCESHSRNDGSVPPHNKKKLGLGGGCTFPSAWTGSWFQSGMPGLVAVNSTHIQSKGECAEAELDKFLLYDRSDDCYRCMVIHEKHASVLQYKETYCSPKDSLSSICELISGDAPLYSMFRKYPQPLPQPCPFRPAPFTFSYNRGSGDCSNPPSRAESCTDDSRLLLRYMACPDVPATESNVEELVCLATWKEGSTRYLVGQISQVQRRNSIASDEDTYRCFIYKGQHSDKSMTYYIAQSGDATCNGLSSPTDGSRTMRLTNSDDEHHRCHFPSWIVEHHKWYSLDHTHQYHFTTKNATLKIMNEDGSFEEKRLVCHSILEQKDKKYIKLVAHVTRGCESGHVCLSFYRRDATVLELQASAQLWESPQDACSDSAPPPHVTLTTTTLTPTRCPIFGRYSIIGSLADRRRRRQQLTIGDSDSHETQSAPECVSGDYDSASIGCGAQQDSVEFKSHCASTVYTCYGSWQEGGTGYLIAAPVARTSSRPSKFCFMYTHHTRNDTKGGGLQYVSLSAVTRSCDRSVIPGVAGEKAYNLTINGTCEQSSKYNSLAPAMTSQVLLLLTSLAVAMATLAVSR